MHFCYQAFLQRQAHKPIIRQHRAQIYLLMGAPKNNITMIGETTIPFSILHDYVINAKIIA